MPAHVETPLNFTQPTWYHNDGTARTIRGGAPSLRSVPSYTSTNHSRPPSRPESRTSSTLGSASVSTTSSVPSRPRGHGMRSGEVQAQVPPQPQPISAHPLPTPEIKSTKPKLKLKRGDKPAHIRLTPRAAYVQGSVIEGTPMSTTSGAQGNRLGGDGGPVDLEEHVRSWERANLRDSSAVSAPSPLSQSYSNSNPQPRSTDKAPFLHPLKGPPVDLAEHVRLWEKAQNGRRAVLQSSTNSPSTPNSNTATNSSSNLKSRDIKDSDNADYAVGHPGPDVDIADQLRRWELMHLEAIRKQQQQQQQKLASLLSSDTNHTQSSSLSYSSSTTASTLGPSTMAPRPTTHRGRTASEGRSRRLHSRRERTHNADPQDPEERRGEHSSHHRQQQHARAHSRPAHVESHSARSRSHGRRLPLRNDEDIASGESWYRPAPPKTPKAPKVKVVKDKDAMVEKRNDGEEEEGKRRGWYASVLGVLGRN